MLLIDSVLAIFFMLYNIIFDKVIIGLFYGQHFD